MDYLGNYRIYSNYTKLIAPSVRNGTSQEYPTENGKKMESVLLLVTIIGCARCSHWTLVRHVKRTECLSTQDKF